MHLLNRVYINIYFPLISYERLEQIVQMLNGKSEKEIQFIESQFGTIRNDVKLETEIESTVEKAKIDMGKFDKLFNRNHIIQSIIHININSSNNITGTVSQDKFNLYRIFDNFIVSEEYPFIQYMTSDSQLRYKLYNKMKKQDDDMEILSRWFENVSYGLSFKIKATDIENKYISINMSETGRLEYKITWKEENAAVIDDIKKSYRKLASKYHPDSGGSHKDFININSAYETLKKSSSSSSQVPPQSNQQRQQPSNQQSSNQQSTSDDLDKEKFRSQYEKRQQEFIAQYEKQQQQQQELERQKRMRKYQKL